ncbi:LysR family transcriptional regulator [Nocardia jiangxiensis]|uniref:LysR family transcriptional regulator n=1 Tax=Nocardia jiangxiensis TaxID=282685 RepID=UPI0005929841|nr:LysR family transcriptional regulator [Nocardia jiangxiensis]
MEIQDLTCFVEVAERGSFTRAAQALQLSQPRLSQIIGQLEVEFRTELFQRSSRGVALTGAGEVLIKSARQVLGAVENTRATVDALHGVLTGTLTIAGMRSFTTEAANIMSAFRAEYPSVVLRIKAPSDEEAMHSMVSSGACDIGFARMSDTPEYANNLVQHPVAVEDSVVLVPQTSPQGKTTEPITLAEATQLPLILPPAGARARIALDAMFTESGIDVVVAAESGHHETSVELVRGGVGAMFTLRGGLPGNVEQMVTVRTLTPRRQSPIVLLHRRVGVSPAATAFTELALKGLRAQP